MMTTQTAEAARPAVAKPRMSYRQAARLMINKHGRNARAWALKRAAELRAEDDLEAAALWVKVGEEVAVQQAEATSAA
ncbi:hypothetical protein NFI95_03025 [Acetobacteraceae bacterium KSS8]|uniref:ANR family transcriptional regulator n=1 Tax=Endosaccharibacter trunci TaxID=2812733 RepID=A0ABT1W3H9_9PROT|nr:hypothetical protein [Acetobacteraceae bacterium KSS8]